MRKYITLFFLVTVILSACRDKSADEIIQPDQMVSLLTDMMVIDGSMYNTVSQNADTLYKYGTARYLVLFKTHHVDSAKFRKSLRYYTNQPAELQAMYDKVQDILKQRTDSLNNTQLKKNNVLRPQ